MYGLQAVPIGDVSEKYIPKDFPIEELAPPQTAISKSALDYVKENLPIELLHHSQRCYAFGVAISKQVSYEFDKETFYLCCLFHDIAASPKNIDKTKMSFEFYGGILAREWLLNAGCPSDQVDCIVEAIFRHTLSMPGKTSSIGWYIDVTTSIDISGNCGHLVSENVIETVVKEFPRVGINTYFGERMGQEVESKPWSMTNCRDIIAYKQRIANNQVMKKYDN